MTNDLFLEVIEGKIPLPVRDSFFFWRIAMTPWQEGYIKTFLENPAQPFRSHYLNEWATSSPADPRAQALAAKDARGKGPPVSQSWRGRARTTKFRSQS